MLFPLARVSATTWRISEIVSTDCILEAVVCIRVGAAANVTRPAPQRFPDVLGHLRIALEKLWLESVVQAEHIGEDEHLTIAMRAGSDSDRGNSDRGCDARGHGGRNELEDDRERAGFLEPLRFADQPLCSFLLASLHARAPDRVHRLRREAD